MDKSNSMAPYILVFVGDVVLTERIRSPLEREGYRVVCAWSPQDGKKCLEEIKADLIIVNEGLQKAVDHRQGGNCFQQSMIPILWVVSSQHSKEGRWGPRSERDAWVSMSFDDEALLAVVRFVQSRQDSRWLELPHCESVRYEDNRLCLDFEQRRCVVNGVDVRLSPTEFRLLATLVSSANQVVSQRQLLTAVWGPEYLTTSNGDIVRQAVRSLRIKLRRSYVAPDLIETVRGRGYTYRAALGQENWFKTAD